jgi:hypothetical protein
MCCFRKSGDVFLVQLIWTKGDNLTVMWSVCAAPKHQAYCIYNNIFHCTTAKSVGFAPLHQYMPNTLVETQFGNASGARLQV